MTQDLTLAQQENKRLNDQHNSARAYSESLAKQVKDVQDACLQKDQAYAKLVAELDAAKSAQSDTADIEDQLRRLKLRAKFYR